MGKLNYLARTIDDDIIKDGLCAVSVLSDDPESRNKYFVVGGVATQSYLPSSCRRPTSDIDLAVLRPLNYAEFKFFSKRPKEFLGDLGYNIETRKRQASFHLAFSKNDDACVIEFARRNNHNLKERIKRLEEELERSRFKFVEEREASYPVSSPEDIAIPKLVRSIHFLRENPNFDRYIHGGHIVPLTENLISRNLKIISNLREESIINIGNPELVERLRFISDSFDIRVLSEVVGFNPDLLEKVMNSWDALKENSSEKRKLLNYLLPSFNH